MKNINHLAPIYRFYFAPWYRVGGRRAGYKLMIFNLCKGLISELKCDYEADFPFNPKHIPKVAQRRIRKACYQSFALYKKSLKPKRLPRFRIFKDEGFCIWGAQKEVASDSIFSHALSLHQLLEIPIEEVSLDQRLPKGHRNK